MSLSLDRRLRDQNHLSGGKLEASSSQDLAKAKTRIGRKSGGILRKAKSTGQNLVSQLSSIDFKSAKVIAGPSSNFSSSPNSMTNTRTCIYKHF